ncbi:DUF5133 domain-containing protein [Streptomyces sp. NPDC051569]|uniref:DUF5133 domain-containing protein n=1 Tax=Streptomyces sp. NPDC051569 TaxID=3365661 RepID=UPI0037A83665
MLEVLDMLLPDRHLVADLLSRYRAWERLVLADPLDAAKRSRFEDVAYTLCVLMGQRTAREAIWQAESYLRRIRPVPIFPEGAETPAPGVHGSTHDRVSATGP